jgi:integrase
MAGKTSSDTKFRNAKATGQRQRITDGEGLYMEVSPTGSRWWRYKFQFQNKERVLALGVYPGVGLSEARRLRDAARDLLKTGINPAAQKQADKAAKAAAEAATAKATANTFQAVALDWLETRKPGWTEKQFEKERLRLKNHAFPYVGSMPIDTIGVAEVRPLLQRIADKGHVEQAHRVRHTLTRVFRHAVALELTEKNPADALRDVLPSRQERNYPTITDPKQVGELLRAIYEYTGTFPVQCALKLAPLWFCRPGEIRMAEWSHVDLDAEHPTYTVPPINRKLKKSAKENPQTKPHVIPLAPQAVTILCELRQLTGSGRYLFPSARDPKRHMSDNAINAALARMGFKGLIVGHGFRHMARTMLGEMGHNPEALERQLSHEIPGVAGRYNKAEHMEERRKIMTEWASVLDGLRVGNVTPIRKAGVA